MKIFDIEERALRSAIGFAVTTALESTPIAEGSEDKLGERLFALAAWGCLVEPGDSVAATLVCGLGAERALQVLVDRLPPERIADELANGAPLRDGVPLDGDPLHAASITAGLARWRPRFYAEPVMLALGEARRRGLALLVPGNTLWPQRLNDLGAHTPLSLWARGHTDTLRSVRTIAIVGARAATSYGEHVAMELGAELTARGVAVVSGAAYGIDGVAHRAALAAGGPTIAVLAGGVDRAYPAGHADLLDRIAANGVVISELPPGAAPTRWRFLQRNRIIAALGEATVVVEAGSRSGSLNTAAHAATLGRAIGAVPGPVTSAASAGCHRLLREFDARCVTSADDVLELLGADPADRGGVQRGGGVGGGSERAVGTEHVATKPESRTDDSTRVTDALSTRSWRTPTDVARRAGLALAETESILGVLALEGRVARGDAGWRISR